MANTYSYPTSAELETIDPIYFANTIAEDPLFKLFPVKNVQANILRWEQKDSFLGLQQVRGLNGDPTRVQRVGEKIFTMTPGVYGEFATVDEQEITTRRRFGSFNEPIDIADLVLECEQQCVAREVNRMRWLMWQLLGGGVFSVLDGKTNAILHQDSYTQTTVAAAVSWGTFASSTPLADFRTVMLKHRGQSASFGSDATAFMNQKTFNNMISCTSANDLGGRRTTGLASIEGVADFNQLAMKDGLPKVQIYDDFYLDDANATQMFLPDNQVVVVGRRANNAALGEYRITLNANNPGMAPGPYVKVFESPEPPLNIRVHRGHNGGPVIFYPGAVVVMNV